jgi:hypothetical protein
VSIDDPEEPQQTKKWGFSLSSLTSKIAPKTYTVYNINFRYRLSTGKMSSLHSVSRRYNDFETLHSYVKSLDGLKGCVVPDLPQKTFYGFKDEKQKSEDRRVQFEKYLQALLNNP